MNLLQRASEGLARKTSRRGFFGKGAEVATGALLGVAAGTITRSGIVSAGGRTTVCAFPGPGCPCDGCATSGVCAKPCIIMTQYYASGCWVTGSVTCCDCDCNGKLNLPGGSPANVCGCGSDYHSTTWCP
jgi:hypothetical protein